MSFSGIGQKVTLFDILLDKQNEAYAQGSFVQGKSGHSTYIEAGDIAAPTDEILVLQQ